jgi:predicted dehydrogenase
VFLESMWTPHLPAYRRLFELVRTGAIGEALHLQASFGYPTERSVESALFAPGPGSGVLLDRGVYPISLAIHLFGAPVDVQATIRRDPSAVDVSASLQLRHSGGPHSQLMCSFECLCANDAVVSGAGGEARLLPPLVGSQMVSHRRSKTISVSRDAPHESRGKQRFKRAILGLPFVERLRPLVVGRSEVLKYGASPYLPMVRHFIQMVQQRDEGVLAREQQISLDVLKVIERARER